MTHTPYLKAVINALKGHSETEMCMLRDTDGITICECTLAVAYDYFGTYKCTKFYTGSTLVFYIEEGFFTTFLM